MDRSKKAKLDRLIRILREQYAGALRRHLPWRATQDPYKILVSEVMLQQTQVERVIPYYKNFLRQFPSAHSLSKAPLSEVLGVWQGLGYNRRAKHLRDAARLIAKRGFPREVEEIRKLPGVGHYTARAVAAFTWNAPEVFVETNTRTVFLHYFFSKRSVVPDNKILPLVAVALVQSKMEPREFYAALMDYGAQLKRAGVKLNHRSAHYTKQAAFKGSARQLRGSILRELLGHRATLAALAHRLPRNQQELAHELARLVSEGLVALHGRYFSISN